MADQNWTAIGTIIAGIGLLVAGGISYGSLNNEVESLKRLSHNPNGDHVITSSDIPIGTIVAFYGHTSPDEGWLVCNGSEIPEDSKYDDLRDHIKNIHENTASLKAGELPDLKGKFLRGVGGNAEPLGVPQPHALQFHKHLYFQGHGENTARSENSPDKHPNSTWIQTYANTLESIRTLHGPNEDDAFDMKETRPANVAINWIIKAY